MSLRRWPHLFLWFGTALRVAGQSSNVTQCVGSYAWSINPLGQTPCLIAAYLESLCGVPTSVDSIPNGTHYLGPSSPSQQDLCKCSSVTYSAVSACGGCQGRTFQNWTTWSQFCDSVEIAQFPEIIPTEIQVPIWAYINVTLTGNNFDPTAAQQALINGVPTSSLTTSTSTTTTSTQSTPTSSPVATTSSGTISTASGKSHSNAGAIAGGVIGGLVVLAAICLALLWRFVTNKRNTVQRDITFDSRALVSGYGTSNTVISQTTGSASRSPAPYGPSPVPISQGPYNTYEANVSPLSPVTSDAYTSPQATNRRSLDSVSPSMVQLGGYQPQSSSQPRGYRGAAEV